MGPPDYYAILGVAPASDPVVIRAAYKALMLKYHPDRNATPDAERRARAINEAFAVIGEPRRRAAYDARRASDARASAAQRPGPPPRRPPPPRGSGAPPARSGALARTPWRRLARLRVPNWVTRRRVATVGGGLGIAVGVHLATVAFAPAGLFVTSSAAHASPAASPYSASDANAYADSLAAMPPPDVAFEDVEQGGADFARAYADGGMKSARLESQRCHADVAAHPSWHAADRCSAFDLAANAYDEAATESRGDVGDTYFLFAAHNPTALYHPLSPDELMLQMRTARILQGALPALQKAMWPDKQHRIATRDAAHDDNAAGPLPGDWTGKRAAR